MPSATLILPQARGGSAVACRPFEADRCDMLEDRKRQNDKGRKDGRREGKLGWGELIRERKARRSEEGRADGRAGEKEEEAKEEEEDRASKRASE